MVLLNIFLTIATFFFMEFVAWFTHKYVMHGFLWYFHKDHHQPRHSAVEKNDFFFLIFAVPSWLLIMFGLMWQKDFMVFIGAGICLYGICYFLVHDVFIHQRFKWLKKTDTPYFRAIRKAHKVHHKNQGKYDGTCFGMLVVPRKFYKDANRKV